MRQRAPGQAQQGRHQQQGQEKQTHKEQREHRYSLVLNTAAEVTPQRIPLIHLDEYCIPG
ncbi:hypothetical protein GCM10017783_03690 [Deinococcus piscis]|uniref:Uncharacterized protein n=1 Tax=Deinococcus piscis TaxID=394230 RepID=A0ABQ3JYH3_9DEIO|nr:hypothetical protein GCM10017783_03690 [Deinococcus piscis]